MMNPYTSRVASLSTQKRELLARRLDALGAPAPGGSPGTPAAPAAGQRLVAYLALAPGQGVEAAELRSFLEAGLPAYMVPSQFVFLEALPQTPNGKVDRKALASSPAFMRQAQQPPAPPAAQTGPSNELESEIIHLWQELLGTTEIGPYDNFFELGGHSLLVTHLVAKLRKQTGLEIPVSLFFQNPTIAGLARQIQALQWATRPEEPDSGERVEIEL